MSPCIFNLSTDMTGHIDSVAALSKGKESTVKIG
jgi:hypothetical protein